MAERLAFTISEETGKPFYKEELFNFQFFPGFAISQKQKSIFSLHDSIRNKYPDAKVLEVSTKSTEPLGVALSAFNLKYYDEVNDTWLHLENVFQAAKIFSEGGPYKDLLNVSPKEAKRDPRLKSSGVLTGFDLNGQIWSLEPKTMFYDWIYINALHRYPKLVQELVNSGYDYFTDIEFNHSKSYNCQARSVAIFLSLYHRGELEIALENKESFKRVYGIITPNKGDEGEQIAMNLHERGGLWTI